MFVADRSAGQFIKLGFTLLCRRDARCAIPNPAYDVGAAQFIK